MHRSTRPKTSLSDKFAEFTSEDDEELELLLSSLSDSELEESLELVEVVDSSVDF